CGRDLTRALRSRKIARRTQTRTSNTSAIKRSRVMYSPMRRSILLALLLSLTALAAHAQEEKPIPPQPPPQVVPQATPTPAPPPTPTPTPAPKKANVRAPEQAAKAPVPFDKATGAEMAAK